MPYANNAKQHPDTQVAQLSESIKKFGFVNPILVDAQGVIIAGHGRAACGTETRLEENPVIQLGYLTEADAKALRLSDNVISDRVYGRLIWWNWN